eukprot:c12800_g1_i1.p1 GENE.c12800_g1_i1~~c12800_g1_i1.p1  ORF type:complete len:194 (-),score=70.06 c12800_g1_i1:66-647(-)
MIKNSLLLFVFSLVVTLCIVEINEEDEIVLLLLDSNDFHVTHNGEFVSGFDEDGVGILKVDEKYVKNHIIAVHSSSDNAKEHMRSFLEVDSELSPVESKPQYIFGTPFPPNLYPHLMSDFPLDSYPKTQYGFMNKELHSNPTALAQKKAEIQNFENPSIVPRSPILGMLKSPMLPFNIWNTYTHYGYPGPLLV